MTSFDEVWSLKKIKILHLYQYPSYLPQRIHLINKLMIFFIPKLLVKNVRQELPYGKFIAQLVILATCKIPIWHDLTNYLK